MKITITQKAFKNGDDHIAFAEVSLLVDGETVDFTIKERSKKTFNNFARESGFRVGKITEDEYNCIVGANPLYSITRGCDNE